MPAANNSINTQGATPGIGFFNNAPKVQSSFTQPQTQAPIQGPQRIIGPMPTQGSNPGLLPGVNSSSQQKVVKTDVSGNTTTTHPAQSNPSVLAQQQALNKLGAGLVEDGIAGPKTSAAIAKYGTGASTSTTSSTPTPPPAPTYSTDPGKQAGFVSQAGQQTPNEQVTQQGLIDKSNTASPEYLKAVEDYKNVAAKLEAFRAEKAKQTSDINQSGTYTSRALGEQGQANIQNSATEAALSDQLASLSNVINQANTQQGLQLNAGQSAYSGAQTQAQRGLGAAENILGAGLPGQQGTSSTLYNPLGGAGAGGTVVTGANRQSAYDLTQQANQIQSVFNGAEANFKLLVDTAKQGGVNDTNIPAINAIQQAVARGLASSSAVINFQNTLATVRSQYAQILGGGTATVDSQNRAEQAIPNTISLGALQSLEQQLKAEATNRVSGIRKQVNDLQGGSSPSSSTGGKISWDSL